MKYGYKCRKCGCSLDPGEGRICTECQEQEVRDAEQRRSITRETRREAGRFLGQAG